MCLIRMDGGCVSAPPLANVERFVLVLEGQVSVTRPDGPNSERGATHTFGANDYLFFPADLPHELHCDGTQSAVLLVYEQKYRPPPSGDACPRPQFQSGCVDDQPTVDPGAPEVFGLRKLLPMDLEYDFNVHVMDFAPGQYLHCNELHYNQHGMMMLEGQGVYRLGANAWYHVRAGDAIYMAPFVPQWYAALEPGRTRYVLYKDTHRDPLQP